MNLQPFTESLDAYVCEGDTITADFKGFDLTARILRDPTYGIDDDDMHNPDQNVTGCNDEQFKRLLEARKAWFDDEWFYCGVVVTVEQDGHEVEESSLWAIEANYPQECAGQEYREKNPNAYLTEVANELADEILSPLIRDAEEEDATRNA